MMAVRGLRVALVANTSWYLFNFRRNLMKAMSSDGHSVLSIGGADAFGSRLVAEGFDHRVVDFDAAGTRPWREWQTVRALRLELTREHVDVVLSFTPKGNIYSALALRGTRAMLLMNVSGLGRSFTSPGAVTKVVVGLYRWTTRRAAWVFFQNEDDRSLFIERGLVAGDKTSRLPGSGVDLQAFRAAPLPTSEEPSQPTTFLMVARLLWDKGVAEYIEAARATLARGMRARFLLLGPLDPSAPTGVPTATLEEWVRQGLITYLGSTEDVRPFLRQADCVVLPSYREGVPRSLLEGAAMARPIIATDVPGCRDTLDAGASGLLCRPRDAADLARCMDLMIKMTPTQRSQMGWAGRAKMEREFDERQVIAAYQDRVEAVCGVRPPGS